MVRLCRRKDEARRSRMGESGNGSCTRRRTNGGKRNWRSFKIAFLRGLSFQEINNNWNVRKRDIKAILKK